jgi:hypothetical protein
MWAIVSAVTLAVAPLGIETVGCCAAGWASATGVLASSAKAEDINRTITPIAVILVLFPEIFIFLFLLLDLRSGCIGSYSF